MTDINTIYTNKLIKIREAVPRRDPIVLNSALLDRSARDSTSAGKFVSLCLPGNRLAAKRNCPMLAAKFAFIAVLSKDDCVL